MHYFSAAHVIGFLLLKWFEGEYKTQLSVENSSFHLNCKPSILHCHTREGQNVLKCAEVCVCVCVENVRPVSKLHLQTLCNCHRDAPRWQEVQAKILHLILWRNAPKKIYAPAETMYVHLYTAHMKLCVRGKSIPVAFRATCQNNTKSVSFHKSSYQAHVGNNTLKKEEMHKRCASNKAAWGSGWVCERRGRIRQVRASKCVKVSDGEQRWTFSYFGNKWLKRHGIQSRRLHYMVEDKEKKGHEMRWDSSMLNCFVALKA